MTAIEWNGPRCDACQTDEAGCARTYPCCVNCGHWPTLDHNGDDLPNHRTVAPQIVRNELRRVEAAPQDQPAPTWTAYLADITPKPRRCPACGRKTKFRTDGNRARHRIEADNPLAPYCISDDDQEAAS